MFGGQVKESDEKVDSGVQNYMDNEGRLNWDQPRQAQIIPLQSGVPDLLEDNKDDGDNITITNDNAQEKAHLEENIGQQNMLKTVQLPCPFCSYTSHKRYLLLRHINTHARNRPYKCHVCGHDFKTKTTLQNHENMHYGIKPNVCKYCDSTFTTSGELVRHVRYKHTQEKPHRCQECDYAAVELSKLRRHARTHTGERPYQCPHCTYASVDTFKLKRHLRTHTGEKPYSCVQCKRTFTQANSLKTHLLVHDVSKKPVFLCELCPKKFSSKSSLGHHIQNLHGAKPTTCRLCGKIFSDRYTCIVHSKTHEGEKRLKCEFCSYTTASNRVLNSHTKEKPYICDLCQHSFRQKQLLRRHKNLHLTPEFEPASPKKKVYICHHCGKSYAHKGNLVRHMGSHHSENNHKVKGHTSNGNYKKVPCSPKFQQTEQLTDEIECGDIFCVFYDDQYVVMRVLEVHDVITGDARV